ncbi:PQQ-dependent sugar dehydrogenase [Telluribacter sp. SYSU D00476]|uniref:PQQ-dependent sugar dehydrogenase n=1 Tax=Telluribacter sp. SYSU D00476 TaxID=2811430 RepID=UPI001FF35471|nr:PQQ-dependent sugar dehydrogenase [Telluribacter sp. SYSU D00476]
MRLAAIGVIAASVSVLVSYQPPKEYSPVKHYVPQDPVAVEHYIPLDSSVLGTNTVASGLDVPWEITWGPDNWIWYTEQGGRISKVHPETGEKRVLITIPEVLRKRSTGLLGMALHPDFERSPYVYVDYTYQKGAEIRTRLVRYTYRNEVLLDPLVILEIPGNTGHNGSRLTISPDRKLIFATGDAAIYPNAQNQQSPNGKILRLNLDGTIPADNPIKGSPVWSWGHRNPQGMTYGRNGNLYISEHGDAIEDEINLIGKGLNYGWPRVEGYCDTPGEEPFCDSIAVEEPLKAWTPTIAPAGLDFYGSTRIPEWKNTLILTTLKDCSIRILKLNRAGTAVIDEKVFLKGVYGRIRDICVSPEGDIYLSTSNRDWNPAKGFPKPDDDLIIKVTKIKDAGKLLASQSARTGNIPATSTNAESAGAAIYTQYCASCHKADGQGVAESFPPLKGAEQVLGPKRELIRIVLKGLSGPVKVKGVEYDQHMPAFAFLKDQELAEVLTYIRMSFGNQASPVTAAEVAAARKGNP